MATFPNILESVQYFVNKDDQAFHAVSSMYEVLLGGVPSLAGFDTLLSGVYYSNYGSNRFDVDFNKENAFINVANSLIQGNEEAAARFDAMLGDAETLAGKVEALYRALVPSGQQSADGLAWLTRPEALTFYQAVAEARGVVGEDGAAIVALASIVNTIHNEDMRGLGNGVNDLRSAILDGTMALPEFSTDLIDLEVADGVSYDGDDAVTLLGVSDATGPDFTG